MGFFKNLKERLFTLNIEDEGIKPKVNKQYENQIKPQSGNVLSSNSSTENKLKKKLEKEKISRRKKENKIDKYVAGLNKSSVSFFSRIKEIQSRHNNVDEEFFEELEELLIMSDISLNLATDIIDEIKKEVRLQNISDSSLISEIVVDKMFLIYANRSVIDATLNVQYGRTNVILMVGVNGVGKTTTIAKIANKYVNEGKKVLIAAGDTFRAGAVDQLEVWAKRIGVDIVKPIKEGADPASVIFDAIATLKDKQYDLLIVDTAGRLHNKVNLMNELAKMTKIIQKEIPSAPHETLLVIDATTGQNGLLQAIGFKEIAPLTGIVLTKMDGTSKGGIVLTIKDQLDLPVKLIGLGEKLDDLEEFDLDSFIYGMTKGLIDEYQK